MIEEFDELERWPLEPARPRSRAKRGSGVTVQDYTRPRASKSAVISRRSLERTGPWFERVVALILLIGSYAGTMIWCSGGTPITWPGIGAGLVIQSLCTYVEWTYRARWRSSIWFWIAIVADVGSTMAGYGLLIYDSIQALVPNASGIAVWSIIGLISAMIAIIPETILID